MDLSGLMTMLGSVADIIGIFSAIFAFFAWMQTRRIRQELDRERARQNKKVTVILQSGADKLELPVELRRAEFTRAEILGRIGMIPMKDAEQKRFSLRYLHTPEFWRQINQIAEGEGDAMLTIPCKQHEFEQFDL